VTINVYDHHGRPLKGDYEFKVFREDIGVYNSKAVTEKTFGRVSLWPDFAEGRVRIEVWPSRLWLADYRLENVQSLVFGRIPFLPGGWVRPPSGTSGEGSFVLNPSDLNTYQFRAVLDHTTTSVTLNIGAGTRATLLQKIGASGGFGLIGMALSGELNTGIESSLEGGGTAEVDIEIARNHFIISQGHS
jgi:hypothetical protein